QSSENFLSDLWKTAENVAKTVVGSKVADLVVDTAFDAVTAQLKKLGVDTDAVKPVLDVIKAGIKELKNIKSIDVKDDNGKPRIEIQRTESTDFGIGPVKLRVGEKVAFTVAPAGAGISLTKIEGVGTPLPVGKRSVSLSEAKIELKDGKVE